MSTDWWDDSIPKFLGTIYELTQNFLKTIGVNYDVNYCQFEDNLLFLPKRMLRAALVGKTK